MRKCASANERLGDNARTAQQDINNENRKEIINKKNEF